MRPFRETVSTGARAPERRRPRLVSSPLRRSLLASLLLSLVCLGFVRAEERPGTLDVEALIARVMDPGAHHRTRDAYARELLRRPERALPALLAELESESLAARRTAALLLGQLADPRAEAPLLRLAARQSDLAADPALDALAAIYATLPPRERLRRLHGFAPDLAGETTPAAERAIVAAALRAYASEPPPDAPSPEAPDPELLQPLEALLSDGAPADRIAAARVLGGLGAGGRLLPRLEQEKDPRVLAVTLRALLPAPPPGGDEAVLRLTEHTDAEVVLEAARVLYAYGYEGVVEAMRLAQESSSVAVRIRAAEILGEIRSEPALDALVVGLDDPEWMVRRAAVLALGAVARPRVPSLLTPLQEDPDARVRIPTLRILAERGMGGALWSLVEELKGEPAGRLVALEALRRLGEDSVVPEVGRLVRDADLEVAARAVEVLAATKSDAALAHLFRALYDPRPAVSSVARAGLSERTGDDPGPDPSAWRRWGAARGLSPPG